MVAIPIAIGAMAMLWRSKWLGLAAFALFVLAACLKTGL